MALVLSGNPTHVIQILHIQPRFQDYCVIDVESETVRDAETVLLNDDRRCMEDFHHQALAIMAKNGLDEDRLQWTSLDGRLSVARSILKHALENDFGTLVMGREGRGKIMFTGSVSRSPRQKVDGMALWVVP
jgi:hypothetical protein